MKIAELEHVEEKWVMQCSVRHPVLAVSTLDGATPPDSHGRQLIIQHGRIFRSLSLLRAQRAVHCPQVAASLIGNQGPPVGGRWTGPRPLDIL